MALYCDEEASWDDDAEMWAPPPAADAPAPREVTGHTMAALLEAEIELSPRADYLRRSIDLAARRLAVAWILKVHEFHNFRPETACLAVNYLDRFLCSHSLPETGESEYGWPMQLLSVACLSVAAKMEETHVPLLLDLQVLEPNLVFEPRTVRRMELFLMAGLRWRLRAVTPFDFLEPIYGGGGRSGGGGACFVGVLNRTTDLILNTLRVADFLSFPPSVTAAAVMLCTAAEHADPSIVDLGGFHQSLRTVRVRECLALMEKNMIGVCPSPRRRCRCSELPPSPSGVLDAAACNSSDTQNILYSSPATGKRRRSDDGSACIEGIATGGD